MKIVDRNKTKIRTLRLSELYKQLHQLVQRDAITLSHIEWFLNLSVEKRRFYTKDFENVGYLKLIADKKRQYKDYKPNQNMSDLVDVEAELGFRLNNAKISQKSLYWFIKQSRLHLDQLAYGLSIPDTKFSSNFKITPTGYFVIPATYKSETYINETKVKLGTKSFQKKSLRKSKIAFGSLISNEKFSNPSVVLKPGMRVEVYTVKHGGIKVSTPEDQLNYLKSIKEVSLLGAHGAVLVLEQILQDMNLENLIQRDTIYTSYDELNSLWVDSHGYHHLPVIHNYKESIGLGIGATMSFENVSYKPDNREIYQNFLMFVVKPKRRRK